MGVAEPDDRIVGPGISGAVSPARCVTIRADMNHGKREGCPGESVAKKIGPNKGIHVFCKELILLTFNLHRRRKDYSNSGHCHQG